MIAENGRDYKDLPHLTEGDDEFRAKFLSWDIGNLTFIDINEYLAVKDLIIVPIASLEQHGPLGVELLRLVGALDQEVVLEPDKDIGPDVFDELIDPAQVVNPESPLSPFRSEGVAERGGQGHQCDPPLTQAE